MDWNYPSVGWIDYLRVFVGVISLLVFYLSVVGLADADIGVSFLFDLEWGDEEFVFLEVNLHARVEVIREEVVDKDVVVVLAEILNRHPEYSVVLVGPLALPLELISPIIRVITPGSVPSGEELF